MPDAHAAAVEAMADELWRQRTQHAFASTRPAGWFVQQAKDLLAALTSSTAVREALVGAIAAAEGWYVPEGAHTDEGRPILGIRTWVLVDAILAALAPGEAE